MQLDRTNFYPVPEAGAVRDGILTALNYLDEFNFASISEAAHEHVFLALQESIRRLNEIQQWHMRYQYEGCPACRAREKEEEDD